MIYRTVLCLLLVLFLCPERGSAQVFTDRKVRIFKVAQNATVEVYNKYGKIHVITWDKDSVRFEVDLRLSTDSYQKMDKLRKNIGFKFSGTPTNVVAKTTFTAEGGVISDFVDAYMPSDEVSIDYMVYVPENVKLKIENKFGDIYMDDFHGNLNLVLSNGNLEANRLSGSPVLFLSSSNGVINSISNGKITASYSDIDIYTYSVLTLETKSSVINLEKGKDVDVDSKRDKYRVEAINDFNAEGYFSHFNIESLTRELRCGLKYGDVRVRDISDKFSFINIDSEYADVELFFNWNTSYNLDIVHHNEAYINLPANLAKVNTKVMDEGEKLMVTYGKVGNTASETSHKVKITAKKKCRINIVHRQ
ncbi:MAG: hypothetical protein JW801_04845 [Bacteroidales bacterium]|nr:hypothetical protein [Bacteroidales bacterium]